MLLRRTFATLALTAALAVPATTATATATAADAHPAGTAPASTTSLRQSPTPDCADNGGRVPCYEYQTWFWSFSNCEDYAKNHYMDPGVYDRHVCAVFTDGATVGLWYHKYRTS
ncbi:hypothetical protein C7C46_00810 [Streptomyces tateyamensis]|uniref:Secreted protein n=1 Tax=Streptomyces tateyamensis TaxID=565073 RepID=A0A2V4PB31_9ACTN|nr:hypothetical protein [Streptomyces tateyamensis]PYC88223.1 hypothetical protein C7C46_00810 [Streptomyces tateyamensis]